ncbi:MAG: hypothetical protein K8T89_23430 [Planctomycetes bacterium]|nr:hypothetical protein [Planctomycetota bacterium]
MPDTKRTVDMSPAAIEFRLREVARLYKLGMQFKKLTGREPGPDFLESDLELLGVAYEPEPIYLKARERVS